MHTIKQIPEDFMVWEIPSYFLAKKGIYSYYWMRKKNLTTIEAAKRIATRLNIPLRRVGFAGNKDKVAVTEQVISIKSSKKKPESLKFMGIELEFIGNGDSPISLGDLKGNRFKITVRNINQRRFMLKSIERIPNLFGQQRFSKNNAEIGKFIVQKNFRKAAQLIDNLDVKDYLDENPADAVGAIRTLPLKLRKIYINAYQSLIWNKAVEEYLKKHPFKNEKIPIVGFGTNLRTDTAGNIIRGLMLKEGITTRDFIIPQMPELSSEGSERDLFIKPQNFSLKAGDDELNKRRFKAIVSFTLPKGSYATVVIEQLFLGL